jgi:ParB family chromosome partitioning protein
MADRRRGMGRGLAAILTSDNQEEAAAGEELRELAIELIEPNPNQPRERFDEQALVALSESIAARGVLQPVLVRPKPGGKFELIAGERRWRAAQHAGVATVPAVVRDTDDRSSLEIALIENMAREDLNPIEEARACATLVEDLGMTREEVGRRVGRSRVAVSNLLRLLDLPDEAIEAIANGDLTEGHGRALLLASDHGDRRRLAAAAIREGWSVREVERRAREAGEKPSKRKSVSSQKVAIHPDLQQALDGVADSLSAATGADVRVTPHGTGCRIQFELDSLEDAHAIVRRLQSEAAA